MPKVVAANQAAQPQIVKLVKAPQGTMTVSSPCSIAPSSVRYDGSLYVLLAFSYPLITSGYLLWICRFTMLLHGVPVAHFQFKISG
jgi:hypothetical protein